MPTYTLPITAARFRLMVVDLDSIVSAAGILNPADAAALRAAHAAGVKVVLASALSPQGIHRYWAQLGLGTPTIAFSDALVYDFPSRRARLGQPLDAAHTMQLLQQVQRDAPRATVVLENANGWIANRVGSFARSIIEQTGHWPTISWDFSAFLSGPVYRVTVEADEASLNALQAALPAAGLAVSRVQEPSRRFGNLREGAPGSSLNALQAALPAAGLAVSRVQESSRRFGNLREGAPGSSLNALQAALPAAGLAVSRVQESSRRFGNLREGAPGWLQLRSDAAGREWALSALAGLEEVSLDEVAMIGGQPGDSTRLDAAALAALMANAVASAGLPISEPASSSPYDDGGDMPGELAPAGGDSDLWPTIER